MQHIFVYGSLKRGYRLHGLLRDQQFLGTARTVARYRLFDCGHYPGLCDAADGVAIEGEVYVVSDGCLEALDRAEGVDEGLYERRAIALQPPFECTAVQAWFYRRATHGLPDCGTSWP